LRPLQLIIPTCDDDASIEGAAGLEQVKSGGSVPGIHGFGVPGGGGCTPLSKHQQDSRPGPAPAELSVSQRIGSEIP